jgi:hypothetical protein
MKKGLLKEPFFIKVDTLLYLPHIPSNAYPLAKRNLGLQI